MTRHVDDIINGRTTMRLGSYHALRFRLNHDVALT